MFGVGVICHIFSKGCGRFWSEPEILVDKLLSQWFLTTMDVNEKENN